MPSEKRILTVDGAAEQLLCSKWLVYDLCQSGKLRSVRVGRLIRIPQGALDEFLNSNEVPQELAGSRDTSDRQLVSIGKPRTTPTS